MQTRITSNPAQKPTSNGPLKVLASLAILMAMSAFAAAENPPTDVEIDAMLQTATKLGQYDAKLDGRIARDLRGIPADRLAPIFEPYFARVESKPSDALIAYAIFVTATGTEPPEPKRFENLGTWIVLFTAKPGAGNDAPAMLRTLRQHVPETLAPDITLSIDGSQGMAIVDGAGRRALAVKGIRESGIYLTRDEAIPAEPKQIERVRQALGVTTAAPTTNATSAPTFEPKSAAAAFRDLYKHMGEVYPCFEMKQIDWKAIGDELLPLAEKVKTEREFGLLCERLVARLQDSHAQLIKGAVEPPMPDFPQFDPGFACLIDDRDRPVVYYVDENGPAQTAGVKIGMTVVSVDGVPAADAMARWMKEASDWSGYSSDRCLRYDAAKGFVRVAERGSSVKLETEDLAGIRQGYKLAATMRIRYLPRLPVPIVGINDGGSVESKKLTDTIGYIYVRRIRGELPEALDAALRELGQIKSLIIDVRGNSGGGFDGSRALRNFDLNDTAEPNRPRFRGPIALLIDERCISAGEGWASWFVANKRARFFGATTAGASSRKEEYEMTNRLYKVVIPVKAYHGFLDRPIERRGLEPDVSVRCSAKDLAAGRDTVLETAKTWLSEQK